MAHHMAAAKIDQQGKDQTNAAQIIGHGITETFGNNWSQ